MLKQKKKDAIPAAMFVSICIFIFIRNLFLFWLKIYDINAIQMNKEKQKQQRQKNLTHFDNQNKFKQSKKETLQIFFFFSHTNSLYKSNGRIMYT